jgi:hypothetical protein
VDGSEAAFYVVPGLAHDVLLGLTWMRHRKITLDAERGVLEVGTQPGFYVRESSLRTKTTGISQIMGTVYAGLIRRAQRQEIPPGQNGSFFVTSIREMTSVLEETPARIRALPCRRSYATLLTYSTKRKRTSSPYTVDSPITTSSSRRGLTGPYQSFPETPSTICHGTTCWRSGSKWWT